MTRLIPWTLLLLTGCATAAGQPDPFAQLTTFAVTDLQAALARATAADDKAAMQCYPVLIGIVKSAPGQVVLAPPAGVVDAFEAARLLSKKLQSATGANDPLIQSVNLACAALFNDAQGDILRLGVKFRP